MEPVLRVKIGNFIGRGDAASRYGKILIRDRLPIFCGGFRIDLIQRKEVIEGRVDDLKNRFVESSTAQIYNVSPDKKDKAIKVVDRICWLLTFLSQSRVVRYADEYPLGSSNWSEQTVVGSTIYFRPVLDIMNGSETVNFIEQCYNSYARLEKPRKLNVVFDYLAQADRTGQPTELRLITAFIVLENLKDTYAKTNKIPFIKGRFRKSLHKKAQPLGFSEILTDMFKEVGMRKGLKRIIDLRNEIVHSGTARKPHSWKWKSYEDIQDLIREYLLRLLQYKGEYYTYKLSSKARSIR